MEIKGSPVTSTGAYVDDAGILRYLVNGNHVAREDYNAIVLTRIATALEVMASDNDEAESDPGEAPAPDNLFGV